MEKIFAEIKNTADKVIKKSGELVELSKVKFQIANTKSEINTNYKELGELVYHAQKYEEQPDTKIIEGTIAKIDELYERLEILIEQNSSLKNEKICPSCEKSNPKSAQFCLGCGYKFAIATAEPEDASDKADADLE